MRIDLFPDLPRSELVADSDSETESTRIPLRGLEVDFRLGFSGIIFRSMPTRFVVFGRLRFSGPDQS